VARAKQTARKKLKSGEEGTQHEAMGANLQKVPRQRGEGGKEKETEDSEQEEDVAGLIRTWKQPPQARYYREESKGRGEDEYGSQ